MFFRFGGRSVLTTLLAVWVAGIVGNLSVCSAFAQQTPETVFNARFDSAADLGGFKLPQSSPNGSAQVDGGVLKISKTSNVAVDCRLSGSAYAIALSSNPGLISWSFNLTQQASSSCSVMVASAYEELDAWYNGGYRLDFTDNGEIQFRRFGYFTYGPPPNALLLNLPKVVNAGGQGSFRITFDPQTSEWCLYGGPAISGQEPSFENRLLGKVTDATFAGDEQGLQTKGLPFVGIRGQSGENLIDNVLLTAFTRPNRPPVVKNNPNLRAIVNTDINGKKFYDFYPLFDDSDPDGDTLQIVSITGTEYGTANVAQYYFFTYTTDRDPPADQFTVLVSDGRGGLATEYVSFNLQAYNRPPVINPEKVILPSSGSVVIDVLANDTDPEGDPLEILSIYSPTGTVVKTPDRKLLYTAWSAESEADYIMYEITDGFHSSGTAQVTIHRAPQGTFTGLLQTPGKQASFVGDLRVSLDGQGAGTITGRLMGQRLSWHGSLQYDVENVIPLKLPNGEQIELTIVIPLTWGATILEAKVSHKQIRYESRLDVIKAISPADLAGNYNLLLPANPSESSQPQGHGFARLRLSPSGKLQMAGRLGDGVPFSIGATLEKGRKAQIFAQPYRVRNRPRGFLSGELAFRNRDRLSDCDATLTWARPAQPGSKFPKGFQFQQTVLGSRYHPSESRTLLPKLGTTPLVQLDGGGLPQQVSLDVKTLPDRVIDRTNADRFR